MKIGLASRRLHCGDAEWLLADASAGGSQAQVVDPGQRRRLRGQLGQEAVEHGRFALDLDLDGTAVLDEAVQSQAGRQAEDKGRKPTPWTMPLTMIARRSMGLVRRKGGGNEK